MTIHTQEWQWTMLQFQEIPAVPWILPSSPYHRQPTPSTKQWICWSFGGHLKKIDGKVHQRWETMELWTTSIQSNTISSIIPSPFEALTGRKLRILLPQIPLTFGKSVKSSRICQELIKCQHPSSTSTSSYSMELKLGQPVFMKEVHGNIWKTGVIDQPAREPDSYCIMFPDSSILRGTHQRIKPRSLPSHFEVEYESRERNLS